MGLESEKSDLQIQKAQLEEKLSEIKTVQEMESGICAHNSASTSEEQQWTVATSRKKSKFQYNCDDQWIFVPIDVL